MASPDKLLRRCELTPGAHGCGQGRMNDTQVAERIAKILIGASASLTRYEFGRLLERLLSDRSTTDASFLPNDL
jgi:hypothetical protein